MFDETNTIFALDIGTRTVTGLVVTDEPKPLVLAAIMVEHTSRAMEDGQIHDVEAVARIVKGIAEDLCRQVGFPLQNVAVAAAGRSLLTRSATVTEDIRVWGAISREDAAALELQAVQKAQHEIRRGQPTNSIYTRYHCVGYSVNEYLLDGSPIKNLVDHRGNQVECRVTATFLPEAVVDALYSVVKKAGLSVRSMTLEPIAASSVVIPPDLRLLNLALIDMGAGTSDIAISRDGMITGYGMVPLAGDEVSECLEEQFILDFTAAEVLKRELQAASRVQFRDVLGVRYDLSVDEVVEVIRPTIEEIACQVAQEILRLNGGKAPKAVICVGGASQTPKMCEALANNLALSPNRVAIKSGRDAGEMFREAPPILAGPDGVTPLGIALCAQKRSVLSFHSVELTANGQPVRLFNLITPTVADALISANINPAVVRNHLGMALTVKINGTFQVVKGTPGRPGQFLLNGDVATLDTPVKDGDELVVIPAEDGQAGKAVVSDLISWPRQREFVFNGSPLIICPQVYLNGQTATPDTEVPDGADLTCVDNITVRDLLRDQGIELETDSRTKISVNGRTREICLTKYRIEVNGSLTDLDHRLIAGDTILFQQSAAKPTLRSILSPTEVDNFQAVEGITVYVNDESIILPGGSGKMLRNGKPANLDEVVADGDDIQIIPGRKESHYFAEVFNYIPFELGERPEGATLVTLCNGKPAEYSTQLSDGDRLVIRWQDTNSVDTTSQAG